ncbi:hypothetical protein ACQV5M_21585, partial [Leptospira sp. SA-E8]|uniref:hypothetical protein n=1 Tax=Leptospira sp. SA-E8 TaxID=3422259 RepID=UPI003EB94AD0
DADVAAHVLQSARRVADLAPQAARLNKQTLRALSGDAFNHSSADVIGALLAEAYRYADSAEHREGIAAFTEKRKPKFQADS